MFSVKQLKIPKDEVIGLDKLFEVRNECDGILLPRKGRWDVWYKINGITGSRTNLVLDNEVLPDNSAIAGIVFNGSFYVSDILKWQGEDYDAYDLNTKRFLFEELKLTLKNPFIFHNILFGDRLYQSALATRELTNTYCFYLSERGADLRRRFKNVYFDRKRYKVQIEPIQLEAELTGRWRELNPFPNGCSEHHEYWQHIKTGEKKIGDYYQVSETFGRMWRAITKDAYYGKNAAIEVKVKYGSQTYNSFTSNIPDKNINLVLEIYKTAKVEFFGGITRLYGLKIISYGGYNDQE